MELKGHNLIIISLDSHFSKMERGSHTPLPLPHPVLSPVLHSPDPVESLRTAMVYNSCQPPEPLAHSQHALCPRRKLHAVAGDLGANQYKCLPNQVCGPGKFSKNNPAVSLASHSWRGSSHQHSINPGQQNFVLPGPQTPSGKQRV